MAILCEGTQANQGRSPRRRFALGLATFLVVALLCPLALGQEQTEATDDTSPRAADATIDTTSIKEPQLLRAAESCNEEIERAYRGYILAVQRAKQRLLHTSTRIEADASKTAQADEATSPAALETLREQPKPVEAPSDEKPQVSSKHLAKYMTRTRWRHGVNPRLIVTFDTDGAADASHNARKGRWYVEKGLVWIDVWNNEDETNGWELSKDGKTLTQAKGSKIGATLLYVERFEE